MNKIIKYLFLVIWDLFVVCLFVLVHLKVSLDLGIESGGTKIFLDIMFIISCILTIIITNKGWLNE